MGAAERQAAAVRAAIDSALAAGSISRRSPLEVTAVRLGDALLKYGDRLTGAERDEFSHVIFLLDELAEGNR